MKLAIVIIVTALLTVVACLFANWFWGNVLPDSYYRTVLGFLSGMLIGYTAVAAGTAWYEIWRD